MSAPRVSVIVVAYGDEPWLVDCVTRIIASTDVACDVVLVDNGCTDSGVDQLREVPSVTVVEPGRNLGFAGGCNAGAANAEGDFIALINPDALVEPAAMRALVDVLQDATIGIASASLRLADRPELLNSAGNEIHFLGFGWVGHFEERAADVPARDAAAATGAAMMMRKGDWDALGGFDETYFAYHEDAELSWRCWQRGWRVRYVPEAIVHHRYEFSRTSNKMYLLERNRLIFLFTLMQTKTLVLLFPALLVLEIGMVAVALAQDWADQKMKGWSWIVSNFQKLRRIRAKRQRERLVTDAAISYLLSERFDPKNFALPQMLKPFDAVLGAYFRLIRRAL